jgi:hypothetical protein
MLQFTTIAAELGKFLKRWGEAVKNKMKKQLFAFSSC